MTAPKIPFDQSQACSEGWLIVSNGTPEHPRVEIQRLDEDAIFASDNDAARFVCDSAQGGSALHILAVRMVCGAIWLEEIEIVDPT